MILDDEITITPSTLSQASTLTPTEKPSRKPSAASTKESSPAIVLAILNTASMPVSVISYERSLPIGRVRSCSRSSFTFLLNLIESAPNTVGPAEVLPCSPHVTMRPEMVRAFESAAVSVIGTSIFIGLSPPPLESVLLTLRQ